MLQEEDDSPRAAGETLGRRRMGGDSGPPDAAATGHGPSEASCTYATWLFLCQTYALCWKQFLVKKRRPVSTIFEIVAPSIMLLVLVYGTELSPVVPIPAFVYSQAPVIRTNSTLPNNVDNATLALLKLLQDNHLYQQNDPISYFETAFLPLLSSANATLASQLTALMFANRAAASPFIIPGFDAYFGMMSAAKVMMSQMGLKTLQHLEPLLWHVMNNGYVAFVPQSPEVAAMLQYFNATTNAFGPALSLCNPLGSPSVPGGWCDGFPSVGAAEAYAASMDKLLWAVVEIHELQPATQTLVFTIRMNQSLVPDTNAVIDRFPQGIGVSYANYIYSGFTTIEFEVQEYFRRLCVQQAIATGALLPPPIEFGVLPLFESACNTAVPNGTFLFPSTTEWNQTLMLMYLLSAPPQRQVTVFPGPVLNAYAPCYAGVSGYCNSQNTSAGLVACLQAAHQDNGTCADAILYANTCEATLQAACGVSTFEFLTAAPNALGDPACWAAVRTDPTCGESSFFGQLIAMTTLATVFGPCQAETVAHCQKGGSTCSVLSPQSCAPDYECLFDALAAHSPMSDLCISTLRAVANCSDDLATICPFDPATDSMVNMPLACLHQQRSLVSTTCVNSPMFAYVDEVYGSVAVVQLVPNDLYYCRMAHQVSLAFDVGVTAGAFPAKAYGQNQFYANSGALIGLVVALSYLYPFTAHVRLIVQERAKRQRLFLMLIGVNHGAILLTYSVIGMLTMFLAAMFSTVSLSWVFPGVATDSLFSLTFTYGLSLVGLASFVASFFDNTRHAGAVAPFILFLFSIPAFVIVGDINFTTYILPPSVVIMAADLLVGYSQSSATPAVFQSDLTKGTNGLFGLAILYLILALMVEQYRVLSTSIGVVGRVSKYVTDRLFGAYRFVMHPFRKTKVYRRLNHQADDADDDAATATELAAPPQLLDDDPAEERLTGGGTHFAYEAYDESTAAAPSAVPADRHKYQIGGVDQDGDGAGASTSLSSQGPPVNRRSSTSSWQVCIQMLKLTWSAVSTSGKRLAVNGISGALYQNRLNCILGGASSGKSSLVRLLMGEWSPDSGDYTIDGKPPTEYNRQQMGVCLQQDVSWDQLTVGEHLELVQLVKGCIDIDAMRDETNTLLRVLDLEEKMHCHADTLSYGMLRKLNVAMAFAGGSRVLFLDEPTSSIDPLSRKCVWHLLTSNVVGRCIVVSTSYVEELDDAHHLVILRDGAVRCTGTPQRVKASLGEGVIFSVSRGHNVRPQKILETVKQLLPTAQLINNVGLELCFRVPWADASRIGPLASELQARDGGVSAISVSDHRLDEVFMRVAREPGVPSEYLPAADSGTSTAHAGYDELPSGDSMVRGDGEDAGDNHASQDARPPSSLSLAAGNVIGSERERNTRFARGSYTAFHHCFMAVLSKRFAEAIGTFLPSLFMFMLPLLCIALAVDLLDVPVEPAPRLVLDPVALYSENEVCFTNAEMLSGGGGGSSALYALQRAILGGTLGGFGSPTFVDLSASVNSSVALSEYLAAQADAHVVPRYGAFAFNDTFVQFDISNYVSIGGVNMFVGKNTVLWKADTILHNTSSPHALPAFLSTLGSLRLAASLNRSTGVVQVSSYPLPYRTSAVQASQFIISIISSILLLVPFTFYPAQFVSDIVKEREVGLLDVEMSSLLSPMAYWLGTFTWNMITFSFFSACALLLYINSPNTLIVTMDDALYTWIVLLLYGASVSSLSYLLSKCFRKHSTAQNGVTMFHFTTGFVLVVAAKAVSLLPDNEVTAAAKSTNEHWMSVFRLLPPYALGEAFISLSTIPFQTLLHDNKSVQDLLAPSVKMLLLFPVYLVLLIAYEQWCQFEVRDVWRRRIKRPLLCFVSELRLPCCSAHSDPWDDETIIMVDDDPTVSAERSRVLASTGLCAVDVWRRYTTPKHEIVAVHNVPLNVGRERLVITGPNGCGKTTLLKCLSGLEPPSSGYVTHEGFNLFRSTAEYWAGRAGMGYAGDSSGIRDDVSPYLLLHFMADFRCIRRGKTREQHIQHLLTTLGLWSSRMSTCNSLSPAMQKRVAVALCLVGYPHAMILDEPTTGLDPVGRRQFWATMQAVPQSCSVVLSSQLNDDVDMLANRVMIMDHGKARQIGSVDELRQRAKQGGVVVSIYWRSRSPTPLDQADRRAAQKEVVLRYLFDTYPMGTVDEDSHHVLRFRIERSGDLLLLSRNASSSSPSTLAAPFPPSQIAYHQQQQRRADPPPPLMEFSAAAPTVAADPATGIMVPRSATAAGGGGNVEGTSSGTTAEPVVAGAASTLTLSAILENLLRQRAAWTGVSPFDSPETNSTSPSAGTAAGRLTPLSSAAANRNSNTSTPIFEFEVQSSSFSAVVDAALGSKSTTIQHIRRMLNLPSVVAVRKQRGDHA